jgi:type VI protein secretion system component VasK
VALATRELALTACAALVVLALCCALGFHALMRHNQRRFDLMASRLGSVRAHAGFDAGILLVEQASIASRTALHEVNAARDALGSREPSR